MGNQQMKLAFESLASSQKSYTVDLLIAMLAVCVYALACFTPLHFLGVSCLSLAEFIAPKHRQIASSLGYLQRHKCCSWGKGTVLLR